MCNVKVMCRLSRKRERVLLEAPLTVENLSLITPNSPLSRMLCEGAGQRYVPTAVMVYVDGKLAWDRSCHTGADTELRSANHRAIEQAIPFSVLAHEAENGDREWLDERIASNRLVDALSHNAYSSKEWAETAAADLLEEAGSLRPRIAPEGNPDAWYRDRVCAE